MIKKLALVIVLSTLLSACLPNLGGGPSGPPAATFSQGQVPSGFPPLPLYPKSKVLEGYGANNAFGASVVTDDSITKVLDFYNKSFGPLGWKFKLRQVETNNYVFDVDNSTYSGVVIVNTAADGKKTAITLSVSPR